jgi:carbonic anhydrase
MSCTAPFNIVKRNAGKCSLKCLLWYKYGSSSCTVTNNTDQLFITYDGESDVMFNSLPYQPVEVRIFKPSIHTFDGVHADAEMIIVHKGAPGGLLICIPIMSSKNVNASTGTNVLDDIISNAPAKNESTNLNMHDYNLNFLIPKSSYFSYTATLPYGTCDGTQYQYVVFPKQSLTIEQSTLDTLGNNIHDSYIKTKEGDVYWNEQGTKNNGFSGEGQIYIDCQPTGQEDEIIYKEPTGKVDYSWVYKIFYFIIGFIVMYLLIKIVNYGLKSIKLDMNEKDIGL